MEYRGRLKIVFFAPHFWVVEEKNVELYKQTEVEMYTDEARVMTGPNERFLVVRYGWYAFSFLLGENEKRGHELNERAIQMCKAMLALEGRDDEQLRYRTEYRGKYPNLVRAWGQHVAKRQPSVTAKPLLPGSSSLRSKK